MIGRILWYAALIAIALVTTALQMDKQSETTRQMAPLVPEPLRNYAQTWIARQAIAGDDPVLALAETERLVRRRPIPAEYLSLLATGQAKAKQLEQAAMTIQIAGQRGWRDPVAQQAVLQLALAADDIPEAARRYAALFLRNETSDALLAELGPAVLAEPGGLGQQTMVAIVVGGERWHAQFLRRGARVMPAAAFSAITAESLAKGATFDCGVLSESIAALAQRDADAAATLRAAGARRCPGSAD